MFFCLYMKKGCIIWHSTSQMFKKIETIHILDATHGGACTSSISKGRVHAVSFSMQIRLLNYVGN
jgi:hypothetical protein